MVCALRTSDPPLLPFTQEASLCLTTNCFNPTVTSICVFKSLSSRMHVRMWKRACSLCAYLYARKWQLIDQLPGKTFSRSSKSAVELRRIYILRMHVGTHAVAHMFLDFFTLVFTIQSARMCSCIWSLIGK